MNVGILALQGDFSAFQRKFDSLDVSTELIRYPGQLDEVERLVIPGGESGVLLRLMHRFGWIDPIKNFHRSGRSIWGTCAGMILCAKGVTNPEQESFGLIDIDVERNGYGTQVDSYESRCQIVGESIPAIFIRAPIATRIGKGVETFCRVESRPVLLRQNNVLVSSFHPELTESSVVEKLFLQDSTDTITLRS